MGHPTLRKVAMAIEQKEICTAEFQHFVDELIQTMQTHNGAGIAAPQVDRAQRVFVIGMDNNPRYPDKEPIELLVAINPTIKALSDDLVDSWEGCLSIPNIRGRLKRYKQIKLRALDRFGTPFESDLHGFAATVAQHELDHLDGVLFIDRMDDMETLSFLDEYRTYRNQ